LGAVSVLRTAKLLAHERHDSVGHGPRPPSRRRRRRRTAARAPPWRPQRCRARSTVR
jgi:hypothetical protein